MGTLVCKIKCFHGKIWEPGAKTTKAKLFDLNPLPHPEDMDDTSLFDAYIKKYWTEEGSPEAEKTKPYDEGEELRKWLTVRKVKFHPRLSMVNLRKKKAAVIEAEKKGKTAKKDPLA